MMVQTPDDTQQRKIAALRQQLRKWERAAGQEGAVCSSGSLTLDALFPAGGVRRGSLIEWVGAGAASGAGTLSLLVANRLCEAERPFVLIDPQQEVFPPSLASLGIDLSRLVIVRPQAEREALWACEEALRCPAVGAVWMRVEQLTSTVFRRLQLAAEAAGGVGCLMRPATALQQPSWADVRLLVAPTITVGGLPRFELSVACSQGRPARSVAQLQLDELWTPATDASETQRCA